MKAALGSSQYYVLLVLIVLLVTETALGQNLPSSIRCRSAANPQRLHQECVGGKFDFHEETWTRDWMAFRTYLDERGIKPTASYTVQPMGNTTGGQSQGFTYAATFQASLFLDLGKLIGVSGLSSIAVGAWSSGINPSVDYIC